jgi:hypothetical protein
MPLDIKDGLGASKTLKTTASGSDLVPHHVIESGTVTNLSQLAGAAIAMGTGTRSAGTQRVTIATDDSVAVTGTFWQATQPVSLTSTTITGTVAATQSGTWTVTGAGGSFPVTDSGGSLTVDAPVASPVFVRLSDGTSAISTLPVSLASTTITGTVAVTGTFWQATQPVSLASVPSHAVTNAGTFAVQAAQTGTWTVTGTGGTFPVTDSGGSLTVDGTVAATQSGTWNVTVNAALPAGTNNIGDVDVLSLPTVAAVTTVTTLTTCSTLTGGGVAHDAADSGNPVKVGAIATASMLGRTPVAAADRSDLVVDTVGALIVRDGVSLEDIISERTTNTDGASTAMTGAFAATASQRIYVTDLILANSSSTNITVDIRDGVAGSVLATFPVPANGGVVHSFRTPLRFSINTAVAFDGSAAATTLSVSMIGFKAKF